MKHQNKINNRWKSLWHAEHGQAEGNFDCRLFMEHPLFKLGSNKGKRVDDDILISNIVLTQTSTAGVDPRVGKARMHCSI